MVSAIRQQMVLAAIQGVMVVTLQLAWPAED